MGWLSHYARNSNTWEYVAKWIQDFLTNRFQRVVINGCSGKWLPEAQYLQYTSMTPLGCKAICRWLYYLTLSSQTASSTIKSITTQLTIPLWSGWKRWSVTITGDLKWSSLLTGSAPSGIQQRSRGVIPIIPMRMNSLNSTGYQSPNDTKQAVSSIHCINFTNYFTLPNRPCMLRCVQSRISTPFLPGYHSSGINYLPIIPSYIQLVFSVGFFVFFCFCFFVTRGLVPQP